nr:immunoglobulin heavy chain junction region [Macaca mulatta]
CAIEPLTTVFPRGVYGLDSW